MALMSGVLQTCARALGTWEPNCIDMPTRFLFMLEPVDHRGPQDAWWPRALGHVAVLEPTLTRR
jgi:hypothetical protein